MAPMPEDKEAGPGPAGSAGPPGRPDARLRRDKRAFRRNPCAFLIEYAKAEVVPLILRAEGRRKVVGQVLDISNTGFKMLTRAPLDVGDRLLVEFEARDGRGKIETLAEVVRRSPPDESGLTEIGARFLKATFRKSCPQSRAGN